MRTFIFVVASSLLAGFAVAKLPPPSEEAKAAAAETAAKNAWNDKVSSFQLCKAMDRTVESYRRSATTAGKAAPPASTTPCTDPGPYVAAAPGAPSTAPSAITPAASKPLEAAGAHSPPGTATSPPNTNRPAAEIAGGIKRETPISK